MRQVLEQTTAEQTGFEEEFEPSGGEAMPVIVVEGDAVILENGAELPVHLCIKSGVPAHFVMSKSLRDPRKPWTWFGRRQKVRIGLSKKCRENLMIARALTWSVFAIGLVLVSLGIVLESLLNLQIGGILVVGSGLFRAGIPVWSPEVSEERIVIRGTGQGFRDCLF